MAARAFERTGDVYAPTRLKDGAVNYQENAHSKYSEQRSEKLHLFFHSSTLSFPTYGTVICRAVEDGD